MSRLGSIGGRLYRGEVSVDFVGRQKLWYMISGLILVISIVALLVRGLNYSVEFKGGNLFVFQAPGVSTTQIASVVKDAGGGDDPIVTQLGVGQQAKWQVQTDKLTFAEQSKVQDTLAGDLHVTGGPAEVSVTFTSASWGSQITHKALEGLIVFLVLIVAYLSIAFEWKMAVAAFVALVHDIVITTGIYALAGFQVSPATVIGLLTILGYSLYDTVVVFDKVRENTAGLLATQRSTYSQAANLALNQTLVRSINTSLIALLPVTAILLVAVIFLGTGELQDLALVLFVGMLSGTYSSICIATPVLADLKEREPKYKDLARRVALRASGGRAAQRARAKAEKAGVAGRGQDAGDDNGPDAAASGPQVPAGSAADPAGEPLDDDYAEATADGDPADDGPAEPVPAARSATGGSAPRGSPGARPGQRQQPRRSSSARRRPAGKKKRR
jgi:preprotein translocase subunit SecF